MSRTVGVRRHRRTPTTLLWTVALAVALVSAACGQASDYVGDAASSDAANSGGGSTDGGSGDATGEDGGQGSDDPDSGDADDPDTGSGADDGGDGNDQGTADDGNGTADDADDGADDGDDTGTGTGDDGDDDGDGDGETASTVRLLETRVVNTFPHDGNAFTQGLEYLDGVLFESTGLYGESGRRRVGLTNGVVSSSLPLSDDLFGAGLALVGDGALIQLTWREGVAIVADPITLQEFDRFTYDGEGWGLCDLGEQLVMSDGTATMTLRDPMSFAVVDTVSVTRDGDPVDRLNELACVGGFVWANVWLTNDIVQIDPSSGDVIAVVDASALVPDGITDEEDVLNGIAYNPVDGTYFLTGKRWDVLYEVDFVDR